jgi:hypothetical protein
MAVVEDVAKTQTRVSQDDAPPLRGSGFEDYANLAQ